MNKELLVKLKHIKDAHRVETRTDNLGGIQKYCPNMQA